MTSAPKTSGQLSLIDTDLFHEPDRNFSQGGRSFYFFDFDDNVIHLPTKIVLFHKNSKKEVEVSTTDYAHIQHLIGKSGEWLDFELNFDPGVGSFRNFREQPTLKASDQPLIKDMLSALTHQFVEWRGPSWDFFVHAVNQNRPISIITARGHHPHTIRRAIDILVLSRDLKAHPNYLSLYPITHPEVRTRLGDVEQKAGTTALKKAAIMAAVRDAFECYGENPAHRFGMSDDDPANVAVIIEAMEELKKIYPDNAFFVINTHGRQLVKQEILASGKVEESNFGPAADQLALFDPKKTT